MGTTFDLVTLDSPNTDDLAEFWSAALGLVEVQREDGDRWIVLASADGQRRIGLQRGAHIAGSMHLDLACHPDEFEAEVDRLLALGASECRPPRIEPYGSIANLADPDGNLFDLCAYMN
jgi:catechol 2,3-dioxygenase-like lactoylglutathione lyase family enzyme